MKIFFLGILLMVSSVPVLLAQHCPKSGITPDEYARRRSSLAGIMDTSAVFVIKTPEPATENEYMNFRQDLDFLYLTGVKDPGYILIIAPGGIELKGKLWSSILFVPQGYLEGSSSFTSQESPFASYAGARDTVMNISAFRSIFSQALNGRKILYYSAPGLSFIHDWLNDKPYFLDKEIQKALKQKFPVLKLVKASLLVARLRQIKSEPELDLIRKAIALTGDGILRATKVCKPGVWEYEIQAEVEYAMMKGGAERVSFRSIIGTGINSLSPHYDDNYCQAQKGEVMVMDVGAEYHGYAADITRTIPVSGKFTEAQKIIYEAVLKVQKELIAMIRPGLSMMKIDEMANELIAKAGYKKYLIHGVTHPLGLDVHDVSATSILEPGMVITIEPGIYIPLNDSLLAPSFRGFGIRIEDDILVTENGCEVLSIAIPKEVAEIEKR